MLLSWLSPTTVATLLPPPAPSAFPRRPLKSSAAAAPSRRTCCSLKLPEFSAEHLELSPLNKGEEAPPPNPNFKLHHGGDGGGANDEEEISRIQVPRQRHIPVPKSALLDSIMLNLFRSREDSNQFLLLSSCVDSILHAEHKCILEEMRNDYSHTDFVEKDGAVEPGSERNFATSESVSTRDDTAQIGSMERFEEDTAELDPLVPFNYGIDLKHLLLSPKNANRNSRADSRVASATRFQRAFMKLLHEAQFEELSARDLMLTSVLNTDYLLTLPIYVDWKRASQSNAIIFRRGYSTEQQKGLLIVEKLDYIQSKILQKIFSSTSKPLLKVLRSVFWNREVQIWTKRIESWLKQLAFFKQLYSYSDRTSTDTAVSDQLSADDLPIWLAAQKAITRYEGILSPVGPRGRLLRRLLSWIGLAPSTPEKPFGFDTDHTGSEPHLRPIFLPRISLSDIWKPVTKKGNDAWTLLKTSISIFLSQSVLQEPAFQELILLYTEEVPGGAGEDKPEVPSLRLKIYEKIPIPDLAVIFPHKKLSFRIIDTIRLDAATILGLLAFFLNNKFEDVLSSPSAVLLDVIAISALVLYVTRVVLGYKQTWDRYQLLVNRTLYEKTLASGFGSVHFLLDASEQQQVLQFNTSPYVQCKEAILAYAILLTMGTGQVTCQSSIGDKCERFMYEVFKEKVEMQMDKTMSTLTRLGLVTEFESDGKIRLQAIPCADAYGALKQQWNNLLHSH